MNRKRALTPRPSHRMPHALAYRSGGVGVYFGRLDPAEFPERSHPEIEVSLPMGDVEGSAIWHTATGGTARHRMRDGDVSILPSHQPHAGLWEREADNLLIYLEPEFVARAVHGSLVEDSFEIVGAWASDDAFVGQLGLALAGEFDGGAPPPRLYVESVGTLLAVHLFKTYSAARDPLRGPPGRGLLPKERLRRVTEHVADGLCGEITLSGMAEVAGLSPHHFSRLFKASTGLSPYRYVIGRRVERARELLTRTDLSLPEVARQAGFASQSHMGRHLKHLLGATPSALRGSRRL